MYRFALPRIILILHCCSRGNLKKLAADVCNLMSTLAASSSPFCAKIPSVNPLPIRCFCCKYFKSTLVSAGHYFHWKEVHAVFNAHSGPIVCHWSKIIYDTKLMCQFLVWTHFDMKHHKLGPEDSTSVWTLQMTNNAINVVRQGQDRFTGDHRRLPH